MSAPEPKNARVARLVAPKGWRVSKMEGRSGWWWGLANKAGNFAGMWQPSPVRIPDFATDAAWILRIIVANRLHVSWDSDPRPEYTVLVDTLEPNLFGSGATLGEAVVEWVLAASAICTKVKS